MQNGRNLPDFFVLILDQMENGRNLPDCEMQRGRSTGNRSKMVDSTGFSKNRLNPWGQGTRSMCPMRTLFAMLLQIVARELLFLQTRQWITNHWLTLNEVYHWTLRA